MWDDVNWSRMCLKGQDKTDENGPGCSFEMSPNLSPYDHNSIMHYRHLGLTQFDQKYFSRDASFESLLPKKCKNVLRTG